MAHARYQQIADRLRDQIARGVYGPGERLPSEPELMEEHQASRNTVRLAIALLTNQGLVVTRQGLGTFVQQPTRPFTALLSRVNVSPDAYHADAALPVVGPAADQPERATSVRQLAGTLARDGHHTLAELAYETAANAEPRDPQIVWERAQNLRRTKKIRSEQRAPPGYGHDSQIRSRFAQLADEPGTQGDAQEKRRETRHGGAKRRVPEDVQRRQVTVQEDVKEVIEHGF